MRAQRRTLRREAPAELPAPLVWAFDGPFERCLADADDALRSHGAPPVIIARCRPTT